MIKSYYNLAIWNDLDFMIDKQTFSRNPKTHTDKNY